MRGKGYFTKGDISKVNQNINDIAKQISDSTSIVVMAGAGLSTASGIPDFRSPNTGIYANLAKYNLPYPEAIFELEYFKENPEPFNTWAKEFFPGKNYLPNKGHYFLKLLEEKGKLAKFFTQNVDGLERLAGVKEKNIVEAHGTFNSASCTSCQAPMPKDKLKKLILADEPTICEVCGGYVKPDIVFFGEALPQRFFDEAEEECLFADLLICLGTSLEVYPFAGIVDATRHGTPRLLINYDLVGSFGARPNDMVMLGDLVNSVEQICAYLDWTESLRQIQFENELKLSK